MSTAEITNIASEYCSMIIELNLLITNAMSKNTASYISRRADILNNARNALKSQNDFDNLNDEQLNSRLFKIYCDKLDNDKYGINKRS